MSVIACILTIYLFRHLPNRWLCDYGEEIYDYSEKKTLSKQSIVVLFLGYLVYFTMVLHNFPIRYLPFLFCFGILFALIGLADAKTQIIPDQLLILIVLFAIPFLKTDGGNEIVYFQSGIWPHLAGAFLGAGFFFAMGWIGSHLTGKESMGFGDVKYMGALGFLFGMRGTVIVIALTLLIASVIFCIWMGSRKIQKDSAVPLGPFITLAAMSYIACYPFIEAGVDAYLTLVLP